VEEQLGCYASLARISLYRRDWPETERWLDKAEPLLFRYDLEGIAPILHAWRARVHAEREDVEGVLEAIARADALDVRRWSLHLVRTDLSIARALARAGLLAEALVRVEKALERADAAGYRFYTFKSRKLLADIVRDPADSDRHGRVARALARSLAANLSTTDAKSFLAHHGLS
jgi:tetratricopeptide (TPR) repeat protein